MARPRYGLCAAVALSLFIGVGLLVVAVQLWIEVRPLREEVRQLRRQMGHLSIFDEDLPNAIAVRTDKPDTWRWRVYLPPLPMADYVVNCTPGLHPPLTDENVDLMLEDLRRMRLRWAVPSESVISLDGEVTIEARLIEREGYEYLEVRPVGGQVIAVSRNWRTFEDKTEKLTGLNFERQTVYGRGEPILLLCLQSEPKLIHDEFGREGPKLLCRTVMLWIHSVQ